MKGTEIMQVANITAYFLAGFFTAKGMAIWAVVAFMIGMSLTGIKAQMSPNNIQVRKVLQ